MSRSRGSSKSSQGTDQATGEVPTASGRTAGGSRSAAVLVGTSKYTYLTPVPAVANSLNRMHGLLTGPLCGWSADAVAVFEDERTPGALPDQLVEKFSAASEVALFYYVGHGQADQYDRLCLGLADSRIEAERRYTTSLPFDAVGNAMRMSRAHTKIVILDCCFSGLAMTDVGALGPDDERRVNGLIAGTGAYAVAACGPYTSAWYENDPANPKPYTHFTKRLAEIVEAGGTDGSPVLTLGRLVDRLSEDLAAAGRPVPTTRARDQAGGFPFARYPAPAAPRHRETARPPRPAVIPQPTAPQLGGAEAISQYPDLPVSVWDQDAEARVLTLVRFAVGLVETDHQQAERIFAAAEQAAREVPDGYARYLVLTEAALVAGRTAPDQARRFLGLTRVAATAIEDPEAHRKAANNIEALTERLRL